MFKRENLAIIAGAGVNQVFAYKTDDTSFVIRQEGYFDEAYDVMTKGAFIMAQTLYGSLVLYVQSTDEDKKTVGVSGETRATLSGTIASNSTITTEEINATLTAYNIPLPLQASAAVYIHDETAHPDKTFLCKYDENTDQWYFEKLSPCP